ncbi:YfcE family phosphodiesterase [candidate division WOR-3 bacterium]|nr:YfcE family phosphodiesterase [candidate division WOR-3 bacterium]
MKVGVLSDSHKNVEFVEKVIGWFKKQEVEKIIHLGDDYDDADTVKHPEVIKIPGVFSEHYKNPDIPNRLIFEFEGWKVLITHTRESHKNDLPKDLKPEKVIKSKEAEIILYGHTHIPKIERQGGIIYINPGHLQESDKKGYPPSFALLDFEKGMLRAKIFDFSSKLPIFSKFFLR